MSVKEYEVYHVGGDVPLRYVGRVFCDGGLERVWRLTNNVMENWALENYEVEASEWVKSKGGARSLMVGDYVYENAARKWWVVAPVGWEEVDPMLEHVEYDLYNELDERSSRGGLLAMLLNGKEVFS
jgi:hypothetical protein